MSAVACIPARSLPSPERPVCALLMAGGSGLRLWPLSRPQRTKPFVRKPGATRSLLADTAARLPFVPLERTFVNVTSGLEGLVSEHLRGLPPDHVIVAPEDRDTLPTLLFATSHIAQRFPNATLLLLASDNTVGDDAMFRTTIERAIAVAEAGPHLVSLGIAPSEPSSRFGYMALGEPYPGLDDTWFGTGYVEKPSPAVANELFRGRRHDWNSGIFAWTVDAFRLALRAYAPEESRTFEALCSAADDRARAALFRELRAIAVDHGLLEHVPAHDGVVRHVFVRGRFPWDDLGTFAALTKELPQDGAGNVASANVQATRTAHSMLLTEGPRQLVVSGLYETTVIVSDVGDTLVASNAHLGDIRSLPAERRASERGPLLRTLGSSGNVVEANGGEVVGLLHVHNTHVTVEPRRVVVCQGPRTFVVDDDVELARIGAALVVERLTVALERTAGEVLVTMSAGNTPVGIYRTLGLLHRRSLDWGRVRLVQMDEWLGIGPDDPRSYAHDLAKQLVEPLGMAATFLDGRADEREVVAIEDDVLAKGGFALALHGIGTNGHIGFNEAPLSTDLPRHAASATSVARRARLAHTTRAAAEARFGGNANAPAEGFTLGLRSLAHATKTILVARGAHKAAALRAALGEARPECPASMLPRTGALDVLADRAAFATAAS